LDDSWWHRTYWLYGATFTSGWPGWFQAGNKVPAGRILAIDGEVVYGFGRSQFRNRSRNAGANWAEQEPYHVFASEVEPESQVPAAPAARRSGARSERGRAAAKLAFRWSQQATVRARAIVLSDKTLFFAGTPNLGNSSAEAYAAMEGEIGAKIVAVSATEGTRLAEAPLHAPPVLDGMSAAGGKLYLSLTDGSVLCFAGKYLKP
jgi:hypothetical protein